MNFKSFGQQLGYNIIAQRQEDERQLGMKLKQQQLETGEFQLDRERTMQSSRQEIGTFLKQAQETDEGIMKLPEKAAALFEQAAGKAATAGDWQGYEAMSQLAAGKRKEAQLNDQKMQEQKAQSTQELAQAAEMFTESPSEAAYKDVAEKAAKAGVTVPPPGTPEFAAFMNKTRFAGQTSKEMQAAAEKMRENKEAMEFKKQQQEENLRERQEARRERAAMQREGLELRKMMAASLVEARQSKAETAPTMKEFADGMYEFDAAGKVKGTRLGTDPRWVKVDEPKLTAAQKSGTQRGLERAATVAYGLERMAGLGKDIRTTPFGDTGAHNITDALTKIGANKLTPTQVQFMTVNAKGMANALAGMEAAFGGRMQSDAQQASMEEAIKPMQGDSGLTTAYKLAHTKELVTTFINYLPPQAQKDPRTANLLKTMEGVPSTDMVVKFADKIGYSDKMFREATKSDRTFKEIEARLQSLAASGQLGQEAAPAPAAKPSVSQQDLDLIKKYAGR